MDMLYFVTTTVRGEKMTNSIQDLRDITGGLTEYGARRAIEESRQPIPSHQQFAAYRNWGLLPRVLNRIERAEEDEEFHPKRGKYDAEKVVECWVRIRREGTRSLPRRVLRLRSDFGSFPVPAPPLRGAMVAVLTPGTLRAPKRKLNRLIAYYKYRRRSREVDLQSPWPATRMAARIDLGVRPVTLAADVDGWRRLVKHPAVSNKQFGQLAAFAYHWNAMYAMDPACAWPDEHEIPLEERIILLTLIELKPWVDAYEAPAARAIRESQGHVEGV